MDIKKVIKSRGYTIERIANEWECKNGKPITKGALSQSINKNPTVGTLQKIADVIGCKVGDFFVDDMDIKDDANTITCPHCGGKIHFDREPHIPEHKNIRGKEYYK